MGLKWLTNLVSNNQVTGNEIKEEKIEPSRAESELSEGWSIQTFVSGTSYEDRQSVIKKMKKETPVYLKREPQNPFDSNAIAVYEAINHKKIGYIPRVQNYFSDKAYRNSALAKLMDDGKTIFASVSLIVGDNDFRTLNSTKSAYPYEVILWLSLDKNKAEKESNLFIELDVHAKGRGEILLGFYKGNEMKITSIDSFYRYEERICEFIYNSGVEKLNSLFDKIIMKPSGMKFPVYLYEYSKKNNQPEYTNKLEHIIQPHMKDIDIPTIQLSDESVHLFDSKHLRAAYIMNLNNHSLEVYEGVQRKPSWSIFIYPEYPKEEFKGYYNAKLIGRYDFELFPSEWFEGKPEIEPINYQSPFPKEWKSMMEEKMVNLAKKEWENEDTSYEFDEDGNPYFKEVK